MDIGERIRFVRNIKGMKQEVLAEKIGLGSGINGCSRISQYESGKRTPKEDLLKKISEALELDSMYLTPDQRTHWLDFAFDLFDLDNEMPIELKKDGNHTWIDLNNPMFEEFLQDWANKKAELSEGKISKEEYIEWKINYTGWKK